MKRTLFIFLCFPFIVFSQKSDKFNLDIARELGHCYDKLTPIPDDADGHNPLCSDSSVRVFFLEPDYYCVYNEALGYMKYKHDASTLSIPISTAVNTSNKGNTLELRPFF